MEDRGKLKTNNGQTLDRYIRPPRGVAAALLAVAVWTWVFSNRAAREPAQVAFPSAAMQTLVSRPPAARSGLGGPSDARRRDEEGGFVRGQLMVLLKA